MEDDPMSMIKSKIEDIQMTSLSWLVAPGYTSTPEQGEK
jgi:hypothetical protein